MKKLLLVMGDLAAGKSTFADILSERYETIVFCKDSIREVLGETIGFTNMEENIKLSKASIGLMSYIFSSFVKYGKDIILESNFHAAELDLLHKAADENGYEVLTLVLRGDADNLHKRYVNRMENENRHPVHLGTTLHVLDDFRKYTEYSHGQIIPGNVLYINANDFSYQTDEEILKSIDEFIGKRVTDILDINNGKH